VINLNNVVPLDTLPTGARAQIVDILAKGQGIFYRLYQMGMTPGTIIDVVANYGAGPIIIRVRGVETALGRGIARRILVRPL
jgi:ferrous iron transport protein A